MSGSDQDKLVGVSSDKDYTALYILVGVVLAIVLYFLVKCLYCLGPKNTHYPDCTGKVVVITGSNTGLGFIAACEIAKLKPTKLILACRDETRGKRAVD